MKSLHILAIGIGPLTVSTTQAAAANPADHKGRVIRAGLLTGCLFLATGCAERTPPPAPTQPASASATSDIATPFELGQTDKQLARVRSDQAAVVLPKVERGTVVVVVQCVGTGTVGFSVRDNGVFPVPCSAEGSVTYNQVIFNKAKREVRVALHRGPNVELARALVGWNERSPKAPDTDVPA